MDLTWLKDYGALIAASVAAGVAILNGVLAARRERSFKTGEWMRQTRLPRYLSFVRAANDFKQAIFWEYGEADYEVTGPPPKEKPDYDAVGNEFRHQLSEVTLVGPATVAAKAKVVQFSLWRYNGQVEGRPWDYDQSLVSACIDDFILAAQQALGVGGGVSETPDFRSWVKALDEDEDEDED